MGLKEILKNSIVGDLISCWRYRKSNFFIFEKRIHKDSYKISKSLLHWSNQCMDDTVQYEQEMLFTNSQDPIVSQGFQLKEQIKKEFKDKGISSSLRILVHLPDEKKSPAGYSLFNHMIETAHFMGYSIEAIRWGDNTQQRLEQFKPNILLTSDSVQWLSALDWNDIQRYKDKNSLHIGLTASVENEGDRPLRERLLWAEKQGISFYYCYDPKEYIVERKDEYQAFFDKGYKIFTYEYTFNPLEYYPIPNLDRDINFVMLGSGYNNRDKRQLYIDWFADLWEKYPGFIYGPGWKGIPFQGISKERDRYLYSRGKVGLNLSIPRQLKWHASLNERTYMLAACGIPQLSDKALLLQKRFSSGEIFMAEDPKEYQQMFEYILSNPLEASQRALKAQKKVFQKYSNFHSVFNFFKELETL